MNDENNLVQSDTVEDQGDFESYSDEESIDLDLTNTDSKKKRLGNVLVKSGMISPDQLKIALKEQRNQNNSVKLGSILISMGFITENTLNDILSEMTGIEKISLHSLSIDLSLLKKFPKELATKYHIIPINIEERYKQMTIATSDIYNILAIDQIRLYFGIEYKIHTIFANETDILTILDRYYDYTMLIEDIVIEMENASQEVLQQTDDYINPTVRFVDAILLEALRIGASDIHFEPESSFIRIRYRIDGQLFQSRSIHKEYWSAILVRIKIISQMNIAEHRRPQDGRITKEILGRSVDFRVAIHPTIHGENIVLRVLDTQNALLKLDQLGYTDAQLITLKRLLTRPEGMIIVTGPTGSGKTTTLYSILSTINTIQKNVMTLEDPVEYQIPLIRQSSIGYLSYSDGVKSLMRQDPDVIFIGEIRDLETANMAIRASMTGHQVFSTLHTNDAYGVISRMVDIGVSLTTLSDSMTCIIAQRLLRKLCTCKKEYFASKKEKVILGINPDEELHLYKASSGCAACGSSGYRGRMAISEIFEIDPYINEMIINRSSRAEVIEYARTYNNFTDLSDNASRIVLEGHTSFEEIIRTINMIERMKKYEEYVNIHGDFE